MAGRPPQQFPGFFGGDLLIQRQRFGKIPHLPGGLGQIVYVHHGPAVVALFHHPEALFAGSAAEPESGESAMKEMLISARQMVIEIYQGLQPSLPPAERDGSVSFSRCINQTI